MNNGNEPAFPCSDAIINLGLTKREYLTGLAMQAYLSGVIQCGGNADPLVIADYSIQYADALLAALTDKEKGE